MSAEPQILDPPSPTAEPEITALPPPPPPARRRRSAIARLSRIVRDRINAMLDDGLPYATIIEALGDDAKDLNEDILSRWHAGGFQDYLAAHERLSFISAQVESARDLLGAADSTKLSEAGIQIASAQIYDILGSLNCAALADKISHPEKYVRLLNSLARLTRELVHLQRRESQANAEKIDSRDLKRKLNDREHVAIVDVADDILGCKSYRHKYDPPSPAPLEPGQGASPSPAPSSLSASVQTNSSKPSAHSLEPEQTPPALPGSSVHERRAAHGEVVAAGANPNPKSKNLSEPCHQCNALLPPLLPDGQRPSSHCNACGAPLRPPGSPIEYCPACGVCLPELLPDGSRPTAVCTRCSCTLPAPPQLPRPSPSKDRLQAVSPSVSIGS